MDKLLLSIVIVSGLCAVSSLSVRHYHFVYELKNMAEARRHCREKYTDLATIRDLEDVKTLNTMVDLSQMVAGSSRAWIGLYDDVDRWRWSLSNTSFYKPGETEFRRWAYQEPDNRVREESCVRMLKSGGEWRDYDCENTFYSVCFAVRGSNETFVLINNNMTWTDAQSYCREHHTDLAIVRNMEDNQVVDNLFSSGGVWIGLYRDGWKWSDGSDSSFKNWNPNDPHVYSESCVAADFSADGQWETLNCNVMSAFICYHDVVPFSKQVVKVRLEKRGSSLDLDDPVVMEDLLKQLKQRLKDQGLNDDIKLSWKKQSDGKVFHKEEKKTKKKNRDEL